MEQHVDVTILKLVNLIVQFSLILIIPEFLKKFISMKIQCN